MTARKLRSSALSTLVLLSSLTLPAYSGTMCSTDNAWDGVYAGLQAGYIWSKSQWTFENSNFFNSDNLHLIGNRFNLNSNSFAGGATLGYNFQYNSAWFIGGELELLGLGTNHSITSPFFPATDVFTTKSKWLTTLKARIGHGHEDWMFFISGGYAGGHLTLTLEDTFNGVIASESKWANGWTFGLGMEFRFNETWGLGLGYEYIRLLSNDRTLTCANCGVGPGFGTPVVNAHVNKQLLAVRLNYYMDSDFFYY